MTNPTSGAVARFVAAFCIWLATTSANAATVLTFDATYNALVVFNGPNATQATNFTPFNFSFTVSFDPVVVGTLGPTFSTAQYPGGITYTAATANTLFGPAIFSPSPVTSGLSQLAGVNATYGPNRTGASENEAYNSWSSGYQNYGARAVSFDTGVSDPSGLDNYWFEAGAYVGGVPNGLNEVGHITSQTLMAYLMMAKDQSIPWAIDEAGIFYPASDINQRIGYDYEGTAELVSIADTGITPLPGALPLFVFGLGATGVLVHLCRRKQSAAC
jgi:hypothetical protein